VSECPSAVTLIDRSKEVLCKIGPVPSRHNPMYPISACLASTRIAGRPTLMLTPPAESRGVQMTGQLPDQAYRLPIFGPITTIPARSPHQQSHARSPAPRTSPMEATRMIRQSGRETSALLPRRSRLLIPERLTPLLLWTGSIVNLTTTTRSPDRLHPLFHVTIMSQSIV
jgi:hypothetical protein